MVIQEDIFSSLVIFNIGIASNQPVDFSWLLQSGLAISPIISVQPQHIGKVDVSSPDSKMGKVDITSLLNHPTKVNAQPASKHLKDPNIFPESAEQPNHDIVNHKQMQGAGIVLNK